MLELLIKAGLLAAIVAGGAVVALITPKPEHQADLTQTPVEVVQVPVNSADLTVKVPSQIEAPSEAQNLKLLAHQLEEQSKSAARLSGKLDLLLQEPAPDAKRERRK